MPIVLLNTVDVDKIEIFGEHQIITKALISIATVVIPTVTTYLYDKSERKEIREAYKIIDGKLQEIPFKDFEYMFGLD